jgi:hypothetical protein
MAVGPLIYLKKKSVERLWQQHQGGIRNRATELWSLMMLNLWYERFAQ